MRKIENILVERYGLQPVAKNLNGPRCIVAENLYMTGIVAKPGYFNFTDKWIVRFIPSIRAVTPDGCERIDLGAMIEKCFDSKRDCIKYLCKNESYIFKTLYVYAINTIKDTAKSIDDLRKLDLASQGKNPEVL